jgi:Tfp pilus assembly protein PilP
MGEGKGMKLSTGIVLLAMTAGSAAWGQNPDVIQNTRNTMQAVAQKAELDRNTALAASQSQAKPAAGTAAATSPAPKPVASAPTTAAPKPQSAAKQSAPKPAAKPKAPAAAKSEKAASEKTAASATAAPASQETKPAAEKTNASKANRRDPFISPVVERLNGSGCSTGKRCLAIDQIALKGIIRSESGMIAVVTNALDKAYFLRENDPVFNGYVVKITGDSVVFRESFQDRLGKAATREVVKKIVTPAV